MIRYGREVGLPVK